MTPAIACGLLFEKNQLIVGPLRWSYQLLRQTIGERFMDKCEAAIFIDRSFIQCDRIARATDFFRKLLSLISVRVIVSLCRCCERKIFFLTQLCDRNDL